MYLTYEQYQSMGGTLDSTTFMEYEFEAETILNWYTFNRLQKMTVYPSAVVRCMYELIKIAKLKADAMSLGQQTTTITEGGTTVSVVTNPAVASQSNDGVSISYNTVSASEVFKNLSTTTNGGEIESLVQRYLQGVTDSLGRKLLYRGVYADE